MKNLEVRAKTVEEAIQRALDQLSVSREEVEVTVLSEGRHGIMGLGAEEARIRVSRLVSMPEKENNVTETARNVLEVLLGAMGVVASVVSQDESLIEVEEGSPVPIAFNIEGDDLGILIGRRGQTLASLQYIVRLIVAHQAEAWASIIIDVAGYKQRRYKTLQALAWRIAEQVKAKEEPLSLEPMPAYERLIIHRALTDHSDVTTQSIGIGEARKVVIMPKEQ
ncbi:RNA-binding cell elongation regulator Jag/EloR [Chloroflexota bacterium]